MVLKEINLSDFSKGAMPNIDPLLVPDNALSTSLNCYVDNTGTLVIRNEYGDVSTSSTDWTKGLATIVTNYAISKLYKWNYTIIPAYTTYTFGFIAYSPTNKKIYFLYFNTSNTWAVYNSTYVFTEIEDPSFTNVYSGVMFVDGKSNNNAKIMYIDNDRTFQTSTVQNYSSNQIIDSTDSTYEIAPIDDTITGMTETGGAILQYAYTIMLKDGTETNPSPIYSADWIQFLNRDKETYELNTYSKKLGLTDFSIPSDLQTQADKINIYRRSALYTEQAIDIGTFMFVRSFDVVDTFSGLSITDTTPRTDKAISYDSASDLAADDICNVNNVVFVANAKSKTAFPVSLPNWYEIHLPINEQFPQIDARFFLSSKCLSDLISYEDWSDFFDLVTWKQNIRFYHNDATTPLQCIVCEEGDYDELENPYPTFYLKTPLIASGKDYVIYMGIDLSSDTDLSGTDYEYGYPANTSDTTSLRDIFSTFYKGRRVLSANNYVVLNLEEETGTALGSIAYNRGTGDNFRIYEPGGDDDSYERDILGTFVSSTSSIPVEIKRSDALGYYCVLNQSKSLEVKQSGGQNYYFKLKEMPYLKSANSNNTCENITVGFRYIPNYPEEINHYHYICGYNYNIPYTDLDLYGSYIAVGETYNAGLDSLLFTLTLVYRVDSTITRKILCDYTMSNVTTNAPTYIDFHFSLSTKGNGNEIDANNIYILYIIEAKQATTSLVKTRGFHAYDEPDLYGKAYNSNNQMAFYLGHPRSGAWGAGYAVKGITFFYLSWEANKFISNYNCLHNRLFNLATFDLLSLSTSGAYWSGAGKKDLLQTGISAEVFNINFDNDNYLRWSSLNGYSFPLLNSIKVKETIKRIMPAPSFLMNEYRNTILLFTENYILRVQLSDNTLEPMVIKDVLEEQNKFGIKDVNSLVSVKNTFYWSSNNGIVAYSPDMTEPRIISETVFDKINTCYSVYDYVNNQIWFFEDLQICYKYIYAYDVEHKSWWIYSLPELPKALSIYSYFYNSGVLYFILKKKITGDSTGYYLCYSKLTDLDGTYASMTTKSFSSRTVFNQYTVSHRTVFCNFTKTNAIATNTNFIVSGSSPNFTSDQTQTTVIDTTVGKKFPIVPMILEYFKIKIDNFNKIRLINLRGK